MPPTTALLDDSAPVRILLPDHPGLFDVPAAAAEFAAELRRTAEIVNRPGGEAPWELPEPLIDPALETALDDMLHPWAYAIGDPHRDTAIAVTSAATEHMGVYVATTTNWRLRQLTTAQGLLASARPGGMGDRRFQRMADLVDYLHTPVPDGGAFHSAWDTMLRLLTIATAHEPITEHRPQCLLDHTGAPSPVPDPAGTSPASDTTTVLTAIDAAHTGLIDLDPAAFAAYWRLCTEWHVAVYDNQANAPVALLTSTTY